MSTTDLIHKIQRLLKDNSPTILTGLGVSGTVTTAYLTGKASYEIGGWNYQFREKSKKDKFKEAWKLYIPAAASGVVTIACIVGAARASSKRTAAVYSLLSVSEKAFMEYKDKVVEQLGEKKEQAIRDEIAQDRINKNPPQGMIMVGAGNVLCYESYSGRYFNSDMETLKKAQNEINAKMIRENDASLADFYYMIGLSPTQFSDRMGWTNSKMLELSFSTVMSEDNRPCIAFEYNYIEPF